MSEFIDSIQDVADRHNRYLRLSFLGALSEYSNFFYESENFDSLLNGETNGIIPLDINPVIFEEMLFGKDISKDHFIFQTEFTDLFLAVAAIAYLSLPTNVKSKWSFNKLDPYISEIVSSKTLQIASELTLSMRVSLSYSLNEIIRSSASYSEKLKMLKTSMGLTPALIQSVNNYRQQLENRKLMGFTAPYDRLVSESDKLLLYNHMKGHAVLNQSVIDKLVDRYYNNLLKSRFEEIALGAAMTAINAATNAVWNQAYVAGAIDDTYRKFWVTMGDHKVRATHRVIPSMNPNGVKINSMFVTPTGPVPYPMWGMGDYHRCRCVVILAKI
jgi:hypothetical protein